MTYEPDSVPWTGAAQPGQRSSMTVADRGFATLAGRSELLLGLTRLVIATTILALSVVDPEELGFRLESDDMIAAGYVAFSVCFLILLGLDWTLQFKLRLICLIIDAIFYLAVMIFAEPMHSGYFTNTMLMMIFIIVSAASSFDFRISIIVAPVYPLEPRLNKRGVTHTPASQCHL